MDESTDRAVVDAVRRFVDRDVIPVASELEHNDEYPHALVARMKELGLFGATIPQELDPKTGKWSLRAPPTAFGRGVQLGDLAGEVVVGVQVQSAHLSMARGKPAVANHLQFLGLAVQDA